MAELWEWTTAAIIVVIVIILIFWNIDKTMKKMNDRCGLLFDALKK